MQTADHIWEILEYEESGVISVLLVHNTHLRQIQIKGPSLTKFMFFRDTLFLAVGHMFG